MRDFSEMETTLMGAKIVGFFYPKTSEKGEDVHPIFFLDITWQVMVGGRSFPFGVANSHMRSVGFRGCRFWLQRW